MQVQEIMSREVTVIDPDTSVREAAQTMRAQNIGAIPVGENDRLIGMITDRDITVRAVAADKVASDTRVRDVMSEDIFYCFEDDDISKVARDMAKHQVRRLPVINRAKRLVGFVALADIERDEPAAAQVALQGISKASEQARRD